MALYMVLIYKIGYVTLYKFPVIFPISNLSQYIFISWTSSSCFQIPTRVESLISEWALLS